MPLTAPACLVPEFDEEEMDGERPTPNLVLSPSKRNLFDETVIKSSNKEALFQAWKKAENKSLQLQKQVEDLLARVAALEAKPPVPEEHSNPVVYETDEEQLARDTDWILKKSKKANARVSKKRKASDTPEVSPVKIEKTKTNTIKKSPVPPPIFVEHVTSINEITALLKKVGFKGKIFSLSSKTSFKINSESENEYRKVTEWLNSNKYEWHTYQNKQSRPLKVMARGIHHQTSPEEIVDELKSQGIKAISAVNMLSGKNKEPLNLFMLSFDNSQDAAAVFKIKTIGYQVVKIEELHKQSSRIVQCKNCQEFNHVRTYCHKTPKCVKCAGQNKSSDCKKPLNVPSKCANCDGPHTANYRGCVVAKELQKRRDLNNKKSPPAPLQIRPLSQKVKPSISYSQAVAGPSSSVKPQPTKKIITSSNGKSGNATSFQPNPVASFHSILERIEECLRQQEEFNQMVFRSLQSLLPKP